MIINPQIYLAPFQGITGPTYRDVYTRHFPYTDKLFTPFFTNIHKKKSLAIRAKELENPKQNGTDVVPQVLSKDADEIIRFGDYCQQMGFSEINWNLGCPAPRVAAKKRGSGMLPHPEMVNDLLKKIIPEITISLSIKCRLGYASPDEIFNLMPVFNAYQLSELIIHARTGKQVYKGEVFAGIFERASAMSQNPVVYNGDIFSVSDYHEANNRFQNKTNWMIGRGLLADPFLPGDIKGKDIADDQDRRKVIRKFVDDLYYAYRKNMNDRLHAINVMKELWEYMAWSFDNPHKVFSNIKKTKSFDAYEDAVNKVFKEYKWLGSAARQFNSDSI